MDNKFNPNKVVIARQLRSLTQGELAKALGASQGTISKIELGLFAPSDEIVRGLVAVLRFPRQFFFEAGHIYAPGLKYHRARKSVSRKLLDKQDAIINITQMHLSKLLRSIDIDSRAVTAFYEVHYTTPEEAARAVRQHWELPSGPIQNLIGAIERAGCIVMPCDFGTPKMDGVTISLDKLPPVIFFNKEVPSDRMRFTIAHELGHEIMHSHRPPQSDTEEADSNRFAAEFLMPAREIQGHLYNLNLPRLLQLKTYWKVSMRALVYRAGTLGCITERQQRYLYTQLTPYGTNEPGSVPREKPALAAELIRLHMTQLGYSLQELADLLSMEIGEFLDWYELHDLYQPSLVKPKAGVILPFNPKEFR
ncbi:MAG TPA: XRE family transcriptional regulator [Candidatus Kapabacteria bacterium]|nr:XRE family transcriptional regulator [Candidatus Kapabacteria bacterium]